VGAACCCIIYKKTKRYPTHKFRVTVAARFAIWQRHKMVITKEGTEVHFLGARGQEVRKLWCIDDFKINGVNAHTVLANKIVLPNFELPARIAAEIFELLGEKAPELTLCLGHLFAAAGGLQEGSQR